MTHARLQLALGGAAVLGEELPEAGGLRRFAARGPADSVDGQPTRLVLLHPPPPDGPVRGAMLERMAAIRAIRHAGLVAPLATGQLDSATWVVEVHPSGSSVGGRIAAGTSLSVQETVRVLRDTARALSALHRAGLAHGALAADVIESTPQAILVHGLGRREGGTAEADLHGLGEIGWLALTGRAVTGADRGPAAFRDSVPAALDQLITDLLAPDGSRRSVTAESVLEALDWFPVREATPIRTLIDGAGRGARVPHQRRAAIVLALVGVAMLLLWAIGRRG